MNSALRTIPWLFLLWAPCVASCSDRDDRVERDERAAKQPTPAPEMPRTAEGGDRPTPAPTPSPTAAPKGDERLPDERVAGERVRDERMSDPPLSAEGLPGEVAPSLGVKNEGMQRVLDQLAQLGGKPIESLSAEEARQQPTPADAVQKILAEGGGAPEFAGTIRNEQIPGPEGEIDVRIYTPQGEGPFPLVVYVHGGGWVIADLDTYDSSARALCTGSGAVVVSTHYRQAPEHVFPAAHDDVFAAYQWAREHASELNADAARCAIAGESAGGNMALATCLTARERGVELPVHQLLVYPVASTSLDWESVEGNARAKPLNKAMLPWFLEKYAPGEEHRKDPRLDLLSADLSGLPPCTVITAEIDPLLSEGLALVEKLREAGVDVEHRDFRGVTHEFFGMTGVVDEADEAQRFACERLKEAFASGRATPETETEKPTEQPGG